MRLRYPILLYVTFTSVAYGALYQSFDEVPSGKEPYDFIIAGGGTAGCVIANRLSENPKFRVLLLEAGPSNENILNMQVPGFVTNLWQPGSPYDWNYTTVPQVGLNGRSVPFTSGYVLGGSSSVNGMAYTRGAADDYNRWADVTGDDGWSWENMLPYILKSERFTAPRKPISELQFNPSVHNFEGMYYVSVSEYSRPLDDVYLRASDELQIEFPFNLDMNSGNPLGLGWKQGTLVNGTRSSAATSYLGPQFINRRNLDVVLNTRVTRVLTSRNEVPRRDVHLRTLEFMSGTNRTLGTITARKEVILSLGAIGTPHLLVNSGIGDEHMLRSARIRHILNLPSVGRNLSDHASAIYLYWSVNMTVARRNATADLIQWLNDGTGALSFGASNQYVGGRVPEESTIIDDVRDPSAGSHAPHYHLLLDGSPSVQPSGEATIRVTVQISSPASRGSVSIRSNDPFDSPIINPGYLTKRIDLLIAKEAISAAKRLIATSAFRDIILAPQGVFANATNDEALEQFIRDSGTTGFHPVGTAAMSPRSAHYGVMKVNLSQAEVIMSRAGIESLLGECCTAIAVTPSSTIACVSNRISTLLKSRKCHFN